MALMAKVANLPRRASRGLRALAFYSKRLPGGWDFGDLRSAVSMIRTVPGDFIEIGAFYGYTTRKLVTLASQQGKIVHAVDSFEGMAPPTEFDIRPEGNLSIGGVHQFYSSMDGFGVPRAGYAVHVGWVPEVLQPLSEQRFSFAIIDLDNYKPTVDAIDWLWPRMSTGGIVAFDDFYASSQMECARAIKQFLARHSDHCIVGMQNYQLYVLKTDGVEFPTSTGVKNCHDVT